MKRFATSRRHFLKSAAVAAGSLACWSETIAARPNSPNEKLNLGFIGVGGRAKGNLAGLEAENIAALCDIDEQQLARTSEQFPQAKTFVDWRKMLEDKTLDAVVVSTPDHMHAPAAVAAMKLGKHVYCEKPLAHSIYEARVMAQTAKRQRVVTQLGNQRHASARLRSVVELIQAGGLGTVHEVVTWSAKSDDRFAPGDRPTETAAVPDHIHWDLWLGPAPERPYHPTAYHPKKWRGWWDFGEGNFGDMACHIMDTPFWALDLDYPQAVAAEGPPVHPESAPPWLIVRYQFAARADRPAVKLTWYDGTKAPPQHLTDTIKLPGQGSLFLGEKGTLLFPHSRGDVQLLVDNQSVPIQFPDPTLTRPSSHHQEWADACKGTGKNYSDFAYGSRLTESALAGIVAYRTGKKLQWDGPNMKAKNCPEADQFVRVEYRNGWSL